LSDLKTAVNGWGERAKNGQLTGLEEVSDYGPLSTFLDFEEPPEVLRLINLKNEEKILDAGCGRYLMRFADLKTLVVGRCFSFNAEKSESQNIKYAQRFSRSRRYHELSL